jgi:hypothetical protein
VVIAILDNADQANALGYHDITPDGLPLGKVFAKLQSTTEAIVSPRLTSFWKCSAIPTPVISRPSWMTPVVDRRNSTPIVCDACETDQFGQINNMLVSDFVYPAYFESFRSNSTQFDHANKITAVTLLAGAILACLTTNLVKVSAWPTGRICTESDHAPESGRAVNSRINRAHWIDSRYQQKAATA